MGYQLKEKEMAPILNKKKLFFAILLGLLSLLISVAIMLVDTLTLITVYNARVAYGTYVHEAMTKTIAGVHLSAYLFNVTNPEQFLSGEDDKLKVQEVGPFTYQELRDNEDFEIDEKAGVMRYIPNIGVKFIPEESIGRPEDIEVTMPNVALLSVASKMSSFNYFSQVAFNMLAFRLNSKSIVKMTAKDYLWGYNEPLIEFGHSVMPGLVNFKTLGILDRLYDNSTPYHYEVAANDWDKFVIRSVNGVEGLSMWDYQYPEKRSKCNSFINTYEGINYPSLMTPETPVRIYRSILCRILELDYAETITMDYGAEGLLYKVSNRTFTNNSDTECLCYRGNCMEGISDISPCFLGLPVVLSNAHFLDANPKLYERVEGMLPNETEHGSEFVIDPIMGMALATKFSVQVNVLVRDVRFNSATSKFTDMVVPIAYFRVIQPPLRDDQIHNVRLVYVYGPYITLGIQVVTSIMGLLFLAYAARLIYWRWIYCQSAKNGMTFHLTTIQKPTVERPLIS